MNNSSQSPTQSAGQLPASLFVTGTDTDAGKTYVSSALLRGFAALGVRTAALKPIASGVDANGQNADALALWQAANNGQSLAEVNPRCFALPTAPHFAASAANAPLRLADLPSIKPHITGGAGAQLQLIEGAGGWLLPLNDTEYLSDWVVAQQLPVLLVVGVKLGCLNHSLLTARELRRAGVPLLGYIANVLSPDMHYLAENLADLRLRLADGLGLPCLGELPWQRGGPSPQQCVQLASQLRSLLSLPSS